MRAKNCAGLVLLSVVALSVMGCSAGSLVNVGAFGSYLDSDDLGDGYGGGVKLELKPIDVLSVDGRAGYIYFDDAEIHMFPLEGVGRVNFPLLGERIVPYAGVGAGYYIFEGDDADLDDDVGFFPLVGLEAGLKRVALFAEARWLFLEADVDDAVDELEDLDDADVDGLGINVGLLFRF
jgi:hypothetical protein